MLDAAYSKENESTGLVPDIAQSQRRLAADQPQISSVTATPSKRWYVAQTHVHAESKATLHLGRQGFEVYLPRYLKQRRHARRVDTVAAPLFPRYLFVSVDMATQRWHSIRIDHRNNKTCHQWRRAGRGSAGYY